MRFKTFLFVEPGITAKNLIRALAGKGHLVVFLYHGAELEHGGVNVPHGRHVMGQHGIIQTVCLGEIVTFQIVVVRIQEPHHTVHEGTVLGGLEGVGLKEFVIVHKVKGKCGETFPLLP